MNLGNPQVPIISRHYEQVVVALCRERWISLDDAIIILIYMLTSRLAGKVLYHRCPYLGIDLHVSVPVHTCPKVVVQVSTG